MIKIDYLDPLLNKIVMINIGKSAKDNWKLFDDAEPDDLWFHLDDHPSPYVIITIRSNEELSNETIMHAANLCKTHSKLKNHNKVKVIYTPIGNLKKDKEIGSVIIKKMNLVKTVIV